MSDRFLKRMGLILACDRSIDDLNGAWKSNPYWVSWATRLDDTDLVYFLPEVYQTLALLTDKAFDYVSVWYGEMHLYLVGFYHGERSFGPFWHHSFADKMKYVESRMMRICAFAQYLQENLNMSDINEWVKSHRESNCYLAIHRRIVRRVEQLLGVDMKDHDLSKSRIVQIALGFLWHWPADRAETD